MNLNDISTQLLYITLLISVEKEDGTTDLGTGFLISYPDTKNEDSSIPLLITNWHIVKNYKKVLVKMCSADEQDMPKNTDPITMEFERDGWIKYDEDLDLALIPMGPAFNDLSQRGYKFFYKTISPNLFPGKEIANEFSALEEIVFIGYPSGVIDSYNLSPLIRRGITATPIWRNFEGKPRFLIDAGVFPGSSGSPVFILNQGSYVTKNGITIGNRIYFIGVIAGTFIRREVEKQNTYLGLGEVIKSDKVKEFVEKIIGTLNV